MYLHIGHVYDYMHITMQDKCMHVLLPRCSFGQLGVTSHVGNDGHISHPLSTLDGSLSMQTAGANSS